MHTYIRTYKLSGIYPRDTPTHRPIHPSTHQPPGHTCTHLHSPKLKDHIGAR
eukprot:m.104888 g.104888  ORF g.104888 m.104888 type:complete len:52 (-) comp27600_c0_seq2:1394-1549(-)